MRERDIERHLVRRVKELGGEVRKVQWIGRRGAPDRLVLLPEMRQVPGAHRLPAGVVVVCRHPAGATSVWVELKAPGVKAKAYQLREHERMRAMGQHVEVIDSIEGVEALLS